MSIAIIILAGMIWSALAAIWLKLGEIREVQRHHTHMLGLLWDDACGLPRHDSPTTPGAQE